MLRKIVSGAKLGLSIPGLYEGITRMERYKEKERTRVYNDGVYQGYRGREG